MNLLRQNGRMHPNSIHIVLDFLKNGGTQQKKKWVVRKGSHNELGSVAKYLIGLIKNEET